MNSTPATTYRQPPQGLVTTKILAWFSQWLSAGSRAGQIRR